MDIFIPHILRADPQAPTWPDGTGKAEAGNEATPSGKEFQKIYFEELVRRCHKENDFESLSSSARIYHEEYYGAGGGRIKRWRVFFSRYNILINAEERGGELTVTAP